MNKTRTKYTPKPVGPPTTPNVIKRFDPAAMAVHRRMRNLRQEDLAQLAGVHWITVGNWERGMTEPGINSLCRVAAALGVSVEALLEDAPRIVSAADEADGE